MSNLEYLIGKMGNLIGYWRIILLICIGLCIFFAKLREKRWIKPLWWLCLSISGIVTIAAGLAILTAVSYNGAGPDAGFVGLALMLVTLPAWPVVLLFTFLLFVRPRKFEEDGNDDKPT